MGIMVSFPFRSLGHSKCLYTTQLRVLESKTEPTSADRLQLATRQDLTPVTATDTQLNVTIYNNQTTQLYAYVTAKNPVNDDFYVLYNESNNSFSWNVKPNGNSPVPYYYTLEDSNFDIQLSPGQNTSFYLPSYAASGRVYVAQEQLPFGTTEGGSNAGFVEPSVSNPSLREANISFQFMEFSYLDGGFYADLSYVDFVSIPLGMSVVSKDGATTAVRGLMPNSTNSICEALRNQTQKDGYTWSDLCVYVDDQLVRILSPSQYLATRPGDKLASYYESYIDEVWDGYKTRNLTINTQDSNPLVHNGTKVEEGLMVDCSISSSLTNNGTLTCYNGSDQYIFPRPTTTQIFGCTQEDGSPFQVIGSNDWTQAEIVPRLCAALHRSTLLIDGGEQQPNARITAEQYYSAATTNHYARIIHEHEYEGMGYAFPYDDTNPIGANLTNSTTNAAGVIRDPSPGLLFIVVGV